MSDRWGKDERGPYIRMVPSGRKQYLLNPDPLDYSIIDAARGLSGLNRYTGAGLSVAQHMAVGAVMAQRFYPEEKLLPHRFLVHDFPEHVVGDVSSPLKYLLGEAFHSIEQQHAIATEQRFNITFIGDPLVKELDNRMWLTERLIVYKGCAEDGIDEDTEALGLEPFELTRTELDQYFKPWRRQEAEDTYLEFLVECFHPPGGWS